MFLIFSKRCWAKGGGGGGSLYDVTSCLAPCSFFEVSVPGPMFLLGGVSVHLSVGGGGGGIKVQMSNWIEIKLKYFLFSFDIA